MASPSWTDVVQAVASIAGLIGVAVTVLFAWRAWRETRRAAKAAEEQVAVSREIGQAQTRAYLSIVEWTVERSMALMDTELALCSGVVIEAKISNTGQSPARKIQVALQVDVSRFKDPLPMDDEEPGHEELRVLRDAQVSDLSATSVRVVRLAIPIAEWAMEHCARIMMAEVVLRLNWTDVFDAEQSQMISGWATWESGASFEEQQPLRLVGSKTQPSVGDLEV
ncbi:MAG: hypothetical protein QM773_13795 [Hyphomonadaceae bacterium]